MTETMNQLMRSRLLRERHMRDMEDDIQSLIDILGIQPVDVRPSSYQGVEIILSWEPYHCITMVGTGCYGIYCYSKREFPGSSYNDMGDWELSL